MRLLHLGQIMSGLAMIEEAKAGWPSAASADVRTPFTSQTYRMPKFVSG